ncbi:MAG: hypothetical protein JW929_12925 [Anaerolineales bacterium]|nr:hypothetical protein [Anaerolineales bacterium]
MFKSKKRWGCEVRRKPKSAETPSFPNATLRGGGLPEGNAANPNPPPHGSGIHPFGWTALALVRIVFLLAAQICTAGLFQSWQAAIPWWPFSIVFANLCCLGIMIRWTRLNGVPFWRIQRQPFPEPGISGRILPFLRRRFPRLGIVRLAVEGGLFLAALLLFGVPAFVFQEWMRSANPVLQAVPMAGELPTSALIVLTALLPLSQGLIEFPWFFGFIMPGAENALSPSGRPNKRPAAVGAWLIALAVFLLQVSLLPPVFDPAYILLQASAMFPLLALIGVILRLSPRWMPWINVLHALMALNLVSQYWSMVR